jgi:hypothetical protein
MTSCPSQAASLALEKKNSIRNVGMLSSRAGNSPLGCFLKVIEQSYAAGTEWE